MRSVARRSITGVLAAGVEVPCTVAPWPTRWPAGPPLAVANTVLADRWHARRRLRDAGVLVL